MKSVLGFIRKADTDFGLIQSGDRIAVGVSGGKDSLLLLYALSIYRKFENKDFSLQAVTLNMGIEPFDVSPIRAWCSEIDVPYTVIDTQIAPIVFSVRKESNPCSLCAKMRRGALNDAALSLGCNKVALGHHREDAIETLMMSMIFEGRLHIFHPNTFLSGTNLTDGLYSGKAHHSCLQDIEPAHCQKPLSDGRTFAARGNQTADCVHVQNLSAPERQYALCAEKLGAIRFME